MPTQLKKVCLDIIKDNHKTINDAVRIYVILFKPFVPFDTWKTLQILNAFSFNDTALHQAMMMITD